MTEKAVVMRGELLTDWSLATWYTALRILPSE